MRIAVFVSPFKLQQVGGLENRDHGWQRVLEGILDLRPGLVPTSARG